MRPLRPKVCWTISCLPAFSHSWLRGRLCGQNIFCPSWTPREFSMRRELKPLLLLFLMGFFKKTCLADNVSPYVDQVFHSPSEFSSLSAITAVWLYATQIYCDFSGYSDTGHCRGGLDGISVGFEFLTPRISQPPFRNSGVAGTFRFRVGFGITFTFLWVRSAKTYLTYLNLMFNMLARGLCHGASWTFVIWGGLHGAALVVNQEFRRLFCAEKGSGLLPGFISWFLTINFVCLAWITFRAPDFATCAILIKKYLLLDARRVHA